MKINITGHHVEVTEAIQNVVNGKFEKLNHHFPDLTTLNVILNVEKNEQVNSRKYFSNEELYTAKRLVRNQIVRTF